MVCGRRRGKVHLRGLLWVCEVIGFPFCLYRRGFPAFSLAKRKGFGQKRIFGRMRRAFEARPHEGIFTTAFAALAKGWCAVEGEDSARGANRVLAGTSPLAPLGARLKEGGWPLELLPHGIRAFRRECVRGATLGLSADRRKGGALWRKGFADEALVGCLLQPLCDGSSSAHSGNSPRSSSSQIGTPKASDK